MRGKGIWANGMSTQKATTNAMQMASARRFAAGGAGAAARGAVDVFDSLGSFTLPLLQLSRLVAKSLSPRRSFDDLEKHERAGTAPVGLLLCVSSCPGTAH